MSSTKCCNSERCLTADPTFNDWSKSDMVCDQSLLDMLQPMSCLNNQLIMMAMESSKEPDQAGTTMLVAAGIGGASFTCPSQGEQPPGMKCTLTTTCPSLAKSKMTTACTYNGIKMDPITAYQDIPNPLHCDQSYMDMMKPMMCANNELTMMTMEALKEPNQAWTTLLVVAGSAGASGALMMLALLRAWRFTARGPVLLG